MLGDTDPPQPTLPSQHLIILQPRGTADVSLTHTHTHTHTEKKEWKVWMPCKISCINTSSPMIHTITLCLPSPYVTSAQGWAREANSLLFRRRQGWILAWRCGPGRLLLHGKVLIPTKQTEVPCKSRKNTRRLADRYFSGISGPEVGVTRKQQGAKVREGGMLFGVSRYPQHLSR